MSDPAHDTDPAHDESHAAAEEEHAKPAPDEDTSDSNSANGRPYPTKSVEDWTKRLKYHFPAKREALTPPVRKLVDELNGGSAWSMLKRSKELASVISKNHLVEPGSAAASEFPPAWDNLSAIRTTHKFIKIRNNGDLIFKKDTFWTRMEHRARHVVAAFGFLGFRPLMRL